MKKTAVFIFSFVVLACYGRAKMEIRNGTCLKLKLQMMPCDERLKISYCDVRILDCLSVKRLSMQKLKKVMAYMLFVCLNLALEQKLRVHKFG